MKQPYRMSSSDKRLELYQNFTGGLNTASASNNLSDKEVSDLQNIDLDSRGSLKRRYGMVRSSQRLERFTGASLTKGYTATPDSVYGYLTNMKLDLLSVPILVDISDVNSSVTLVNDTSLMKAIPMISKCNAYGTNVLLQFVPWVQGGTVSAKDYNPTNLDAFFVNWEASIKGALTTLAKYGTHAWGIELMCNATMFESGNDSRFNTLITNIRNVFKGKLTYRTNYWTSTSAYTTKYNIGFWSNLDFISMSAYWNLTDALNPTYFDVKQCIQYTTKTGQNLYLYNQIQSFNTKFNKPIFFGEFGCPKVNGFASEPSNPLVSTTTNRQGQVSYYKGYFDTFKDQIWWMGYSANNVDAMSDKYCLTTNPFASLEVTTENLTDTSALPVGNGQGYFRHVKQDGTVTEIIAIAGKLYNSNSGVNIPITNMDNGFQTTRMIEGIQYGDTLYIATGSGLVEYDGTTAKTVTPYTPQPLEALYIGTNGLSSNPNNYIQDGVGAFAINAITFDNRIGIAGKPTNFRIVMTKGGTDKLDFEIVYFNGTDVTTTPTTIQAATTGGVGSQNFSWTPQNAGTFTIRVKAWKTGVTTGNPDSTYYMTYTVTATDTNNALSSSTIQTCNRLVLHWDRLYLYGDTTSGMQMYVSHLNNPRYFPVPNIVDFKSPNQEPITALVRYRDALVIFLKSSIVALYGKTPSEFNKQNVNNSIGCIAPFSACVVGNDVIFLSADGVYKLSSLKVDVFTLNVDKLDNPIRNVVPKDTNACGIFYDAQYHLVFPNSQTRFRYHIDFKVWTRDISPKLTFGMMCVYNNILYGNSLTDGILYSFDRTRWDDDGYVYMDRIETKQYDMGYPYHTKKIKEIRIIAATQNRKVNLAVTVFSDKTIALAPVMGQAVVDSNGSVVWKDGSQPNMTVETGTVIGGWILGQSKLGHPDNMINKLIVSARCNRTSIAIEHSEAVPNEILGLSYIYKFRPKP